MAFNTVAELLNAVDNKQLNKDSSIEAIIAAGWYDWFCQTTSLRAKTFSLIAKVRKLAKLNVFDPEKTRVMFKNNCPVDGSLYDSFSIIDNETNRIVFWVAAKLGYNTDLFGKAMIVKYTADGEQQLLFDTWKEAVASFK